MTVAEFVLAFIFMATAVMTVVVVGTLGAADLLRPPHGHRGAEAGRDRSRLEHRPEAGQAQHDPQHGRAA